jgi:nucleoside-diphosphate-sugar epimerase
MFYSSSPIEKVAVIGCGYVGKAMARYWYSQGLEVTGTTTRAENRAELAEFTHKVEIMLGKDLDAVQRVLDGQETVFVSIAPISDRQVTPLAYRETYLPLAENLLTALATNPTVKQVIYLSSCAVYGNQKGAWVDETTALANLQDHGQVLAEVEARLQEQKNLCIFRLGGIYGLGRELDKRLGKLAGKTMPSSGKNYTNWIHLEDIIGAGEFVRQQHCQGIYNLVNDTKLTSRELFNLICDRQGLERVHWDANQAPYTEVNVRVSNSKIKALGYQFIYPDTFI